MMKKTVLALLLLAFIHVTCHQALFVAPPGSTMDLFANPTFIPAHGGVSIISALLIEPAGTPVADGTVVQCFSDLGHVDEQARTNDGVARLNFVSDSRSGRATISCFSGGGTAPAPPPSPSPSPGTGGDSQGVSGIAAADTVTVDIGSEIPNLIFVQAEPPRITESRTTHIIATVFGRSGNPVANAPVFFNVLVGENTSTLEFMERQGPVFTDQNGNAEDIMRTRRQGPITITVRVRARTPSSGAGVVESFVDVPIIF